MSSVFTESNDVNTQYHFVVEPLHVFAQLEYSQKQLTSNQNSENSTTLIENPKINIEVGGGYSFEDFSKNSNINLKNQQSLKLRITPQIVDDLSSFLERCQFYYLVKDLKQYRPARRPICQSQVPNEFVHNPVVKHKRKLLVRDWLFFVIWSVRLKKILKNQSDSNSE